MTGAWINSLNQWGVVWASSMERASWQGGVALAVAWAACRAWPKMPSLARCWLWRLAYLKLLVAVIYVAPVDLPLLSPASPATSSVRVPHGPVASPAPWALQSKRSMARSSASGTPLPTVAKGLLLIWLLGVGGSIGRGVWEWRQLQRLCRGGEPIQEEGITACCIELCQRMGLYSTPHLLVAPGTGSPLLLGMPRPAIILPAWLLTECSMSQLRLMLAHELTHLQRRDLVWGCLPGLAQALFWFHPLVWLAGRDWHLAQELACDEKAVLVTNSSPGDYGDLLLKVAAQCRTYTAGGLVTVGVLDSYQTLQRRLIAMKSIGQVSGRRIAAIGAMLAALGVVVLVPWRVTAQTGGNTESQMRLKHLGKALVMYVLDYDEVLPPMKDPTTVKGLLHPYMYMNNDVFFLDPRTNEPYQPNPSVSGRRVASVTRLVRRPGRGHAKRLTRQAEISRPWEMVAFYERTPASDGTRGVLFVNGRVGRVSDVRWQQLKRSSNIH